MITKKVLVEMSAKRKMKVFSLTLALIVAVAASVAFILFSNSALDILPVVLSTKEHKSPRRVPLVFREDYSDEASKGVLTFDGDNAFNFSYVKSSQKSHPFAGAMFPLENVSIDFSEYDLIEIGIETNKARRIPVNLSVQNKKETHQYVRSFIEVVEGQDYYKIRLDEFFTPTSWYDRNSVAQVDIPAPDYSLIEALSFESCHLLSTEVRDEYRIYHLVLKKDLTWEMVIISTVAAVIVFVLWLLLFVVGKKEVEVVHVPIEVVEFEAGDDIEDQVMVYLSKHYSNPNLSLADLTEEFGKNGNELSKVIKSKTEKTFPQYLNFLRIEAAKKLLSVGDYGTISQVGYAVGFNSPSNFNRVFKSIEGVSPKGFLDLPN